MTDDPADRDINELEDILAHRTVPPRDVVPPKGLDRETILALNAAAMTDISVTEPPELRCTPEGDPLPMAPSVTEHFTMGKPVIPLHLLKAAGLTEADVPNLRIIDVER